MDKIIEEYITLDFINNELLFNKKNYHRMIASNYQKSKDTTLESAPNFALFVTEKR